MNRIKLIVIAVVLILVGIVADNSRQFSSAAKDDEVLSEIAKYKSWTKVSKKPIKVETLNLLKKDSIGVDVSDLGGG